MKKIPKALRSRLMKLALMMLAVVMFGVIYGLIAHDRILLLLTAVLDVSGTIHLASMYRMILEKRYTVSEGTLLSAKVLHAQKRQILVLVDDEGHEMELILAGATHMKVGRQYRLYLSENTENGPDMPKTGWLSPARTLLGVDILG